MIYSAQSMGSLLEKLNIKTNNFLKIFWTHQEISVPSLNKIPLSDIWQNMSLSATGKKGFRKGTNRMILQVDRSSNALPSIHPIHEGKSFCFTLEWAVAGEGQDCPPNLFAWKFLFNFITKTKTLNVEQCSPNLLAWKFFFFNYEALTLCLKVPFFNFAPLTL